MQRFRLYRLYLPGHDAVHGNPAFRVELLQEGVVPTRQG